MSKLWRDFDCESIESKLYIKLLWLTINWIAAHSNTRVQGLTTVEEAKIHISTGLRQVLAPWIGTHPMVCGHADEQQANCQAAAEECGEDQRTGAYAHLAGSVVAKQKVNL